VRFFVRRKSREQVLEDANRDLWLDAEEAKATV
jgi:ATP-dependent protease ClpP protease subunit